MKIATLAISAALVVVFAAATARAAVVDDFSSDTSSLYVSSQGVAVYSRNGNEFQPTGGASNERTAFLRNDLMFDVGDTIGIDLTSVPRDNVTPTTGAKAGIALSQSPAAGIYHDWYLQDSSGAFAAQGDFWNGQTWESPIAPAAGAYQTPTTAQPANITLTRTSQSDVDYTFTYYTDLGTETISGTNTGLLLNGPYFFGPMKGQWIGSAYDATVALDNLTFGLPIPEPSTTALLVTGLMGLLCSAWRKRK